jgi:hypothetical protein
VPRRSAFVLVCAALAGALCAGAARASHAAQACGVAPYSYAGVVGPQATHGVMATVAVVADPQILHGHVAAWVGVGGVGLGPHGTSEWLQVGFAATDTTTTQLYYELTQPHQTPRFVALRARVTAGEQHRFGVIEMAQRPNWWRVWLDGNPVTKPIHLAASHGQWAPVATSESWNGGVPSCNAFDFRFANIRWSDAPAKWRPLDRANRIDSPGYVVRRTPQGGLVVRGGEPAPAPAVISVPLVQ